MKRCWTTQEVAPATMRPTSTSKRADGAGSAGKWITSSSTTLIRRSRPGWRNTTGTRSGKPRSANDSSTSRSRQRSTEASASSGCSRRSPGGCHNAPLFRFVYAYFLRLGFLDGKPGFIFCGLLAFYDFLASANRYEQQIAKCLSAPEPVAGQVADTEDTSIRRLCPISDDWGRSVNLERAHSRWANNSPIIVWLILRFEGLA